MNRQLPETKSENARIVAELRQIFEPAALRLAPEVEPATIFVPAHQTPEKEPAQ